MAKGLKRILGIAGLVVREALSRRMLERTPEPSAEMVGQESVAGFHAAGDEDLTPIYHFNAWAVSALAPAGANIVDLGCGSGQFLAYLAERRPDVNILGLDLSSEMVAQGRRMLVERGLRDRVRLVIGDMRDFRTHLAEPVQVITSVFSLHHLPTSSDLERCMGEVGALVREQGASFWIFDHARPKNVVTAGVFPEVFTPEATPAFKRDSSNSLKAAWSFGELAQALSQALSLPHECSLARFLPLYQIHWLCGGAYTARDVGWMEPDLSAVARRDAAALAGLFLRRP